MTLNLSQERQVAVGMLTKLAAALPSADLNTRNRLMGLMSQALEFYDGLAGFDQPEPEPQPEAETQPEPEPEPQPVVIDIQAAVRRVVADLPSRGRTTGDRQSWRAEVERRLAREENEIRRQVGDGRRAGGYTGVLRQQVRRATGL